VERDAASLGNSPFFLDISILRNEATTLSRNIGYNLPSGASSF